MVALGPLSRRRLLASAGAGGSALLLGACGGGSGSKTQTTTTTGGVGQPALGDIELLNSLLDREHRTAAGYEAIAPGLKGRALAAARMLAGQERAHAAAIERAIRDLEGKPVAPGSYDVPEFKEPGDELRFALGLEGTAVAAYIDALPKLSSPDLRGTASALLTSAAEHASVLLGLLDRPQVPDAFVIGRQA